MYFLPWLFWCAPFLGSKERVLLGQPYCSPDWTTGCCQVLLDAGRNRPACQESSGSCLGESLLECFFFFELNIYIEVVEEWSIDRAYCTDSSRHPEILWWRFIVQFRCFWVRFMFEIMGKLLDTKQLKTYWCDPPCQPWTYIYIYSSIENLHKTKTIHNSCRSFTFKVGFCIVFTRESSSWLYNI